MAVVIGRVVIMIAVGVGVRMLVDVRGARIFATYAELRGAHPGTHHLFRPDRVRRYRERTEGTADAVERYAGVDQRTEDHVARSAREAIEVQNPQIQPILPCASFVGCQPSP